MINKDDPYDGIPEEFRESPSVRRMSTSLGDKYLWDVSSECRSSYPDMSDQEHEKGLDILEHAP